MFRIGSTKHEVLKRYFGYDAFRPGQEELIDAILAGKDCLGIMPTGAGKSICYQIPALLLPGITLVISPLISLMKDQVNALTQSGVPAAYINSSLTERQVLLAIENARQGRYRILYVAPERLEMGEFRAFASSMEVSMLTVDEAHCISQWGQDFRPSYLGIRAFVDALPRRPVLSAFTATATDLVREDVALQLRLHEPQVLVSGFDRPNLFFEVLEPKQKKGALLEFLAERKDESGIVYCSTRKAVEQVEELLAENGFSVRRYHAGLTDNERRENQDDFRYDRASIMVATNAFGMGIDKSNVRFVVHFNMPKDVESYYQEAGRAGRDGEPAHCLLLYSAQDVVTANYLIDHGRGSLGEEEGDPRAKERDRKRLREMTYYCRTSGCLRGYILRYFGEEAADSCENCGNCQDDSDREDVTVLAQKILSCVARMRGRYGVKMVLDVLRGEKSERILGLGLDKLSTYGIASESVRKLRGVVDHLIMTGCLTVTEGEYPLLRLGENAEDVLRGKASVAMKPVKEREREARERAPRDRRRSAGTTPARPMDQALFSQLVALRSELARKQNVPAYVVFPDSALADMSIRQPSNTEEFLDVSGVGQVKLERYGEAFLRVIAEYLEGAGAKPAVPIPPAAAPEPLGTDVAASDEPVSVSIVADRMNIPLIERGLKKITGAALNKWLLAKGYLKEEDGSKIATEQGEAIGITTTERSYQDRTYKVCVFDMNAQKIIAEEALKDLYPDEIRPA